MPGPSRKLSFSIYEDVDCRIPGSLPRLDAGAGQMGLSTHIPPPPPFTTRVPSTAASSASSAAGVVGRTGSTTDLSPPFTVRVPSSGSSTTSSSVVRRSRPSGLTTPVDPHHCASGSALVFRVPSTVSSSTGPSSTCSSSTSFLSTGSSWASFSSAGSFARLADRSRLMTPVGTRHYATDNSPFRTRRPSAGPFNLRRGSDRSLSGSGLPFSSSSSSSTGSFYYKRKDVDVSVKKRVPRRRQPQIRMSLTDSRGWKASTPTTSLTYDETVEIGSLGGPEQPYYGAPQEQQQHTPADTPESQKCVGSFVEDWIRKSIEHGGIAAVRQEDVSDHTDLQQQEQLPTPADTPASQGVIDVPARAPGADEFLQQEDRDRITISEQAGDGTTGTLGDLERLSLADNEVEEEQRGVRDGHLPSTRQPPSILAPRRGPQPRDALGRFASYSASDGVKMPRQRGSRVRKSARSRRRNEIELTMYHAICWSGMGDIVPNISVATGEPLVRMPLPCTFGEGPGGKPVGEEEDFAVGVSRGLVGEIEKGWARRARRKEAGI
ncbi:hypothetical protein VM1G_06673 [Cytospora mali]|uniref:Uncharacterized protein n=1 Tax=Cytospora mali TaxID=578113 RepID=A0A194W5R7_CYTMA|nr:hypothetical protein VM1G_06673 [Valsa mali]